MTSEFGTLLAQVIPVVILALVLEARVFLRQFRNVAENEADGERARDYPIDKLESVTRLLFPTFAERAFPDQAEMDKSSGDGQEDDKVFGSLATHRSRFLLNDFVAFVYALACGGLVVLLARSELVCLLAAMGQSVPAIEARLAVMEIFYGLAVASTVPCAYLLYIHLGGWRVRAWIALLALVGGMFGLLVVMGSGMLYA